MRVCGVKCQTCFMDQIYRKDKLIASTFSKAELPDIYEQAQNRYFLDKVRMLRYARRRNRQNLLLTYLEGSKAEDVTL